MNPSRNLFLMEAKISERFMKKLIEISSEMLNDYEKPLMYAYYLA